MWAFFFDRLNPEVSSLFKKAGKNARTMSLFILMDEYPSSMAEQLKQLIENRGPMVSQLAKATSNCYLDDFVFYRRLKCYRGSRIC